MPLSGYSEQEKSKKLSKLIKSVSDLIKQAKDTSVPCEDGK